MAEKKSNRDRLKEITASIEDGIKELFQSETYAQYLQTMSRFHHYSVNNQVLIHMQKPDATQQMEESVRKECHQGRTRH